MLKIGRLQNNNLIIINYVHRYYLVHSFFDINLVFFTNDIKK